ncbi:Protein phosphatase inhibitor 2 [Halotydeus destructor]|nr:Protein phosphatase inhibitor 2 [Halotydeus destructor]
MENLTKKPAKGILKSSSSFEQPDPPVLPKPHSDIKWDEMNILKTLHPADKDYGLMKIDEPKTPYYAPEDSAEQSLDPDLLAKKIQESQEQPDVIEEEEDGAEEDEEDLTDEEKKLRKDFELKRKSHYNEFHAVKLARQLLEEEDDEEEGANEESSDNPVEIVEEASGRGEASA